MEEIVLHRRSFTGPLPEGTVVRCANCGLVDPARDGHDTSDCLRALRDEVARLRAELVEVNEAGGVALVVPAGV